MATAISASTRRLLEISYLPGVGTVALRRAVSAARRKGPEVLNDLDFLHSLATSSERSTKRDQSCAVLDECETRLIGILSPLDEGYPSALARIDDYPPIIYYLGNQFALSMIGCAVVGTREASRLGLSWARQIAEIIARAQMCVVSGLALGIDTAAHEGALRASGKTVAILAHGLDVVTPASNRALAREILESDGALVSEHPPGVPPRRAEYVRRNRIQSGMSMCSIVVESGEDGGAIHQGNFTHRQGRRLFSVLPSRDIEGADEFNYGGAKRLMSEAASMPISNKEQLLDLIESGLLKQDFDKLATSLPTGALL